MLSWGNWQAHDPRYEMPYVEWVHDLHGARHGSKPEFEPQVAPRSIDRFADLDHAATVLGHTPGNAAPWTEGAAPFVFLTPEYMNNSDFADWWAAHPDKRSWLPAADAFDYPQVDEDTVIAGVIDVGLALGHRRFRTAEGRSRVLGTWIQGAAPLRDGGGAPVVPHLPFGRHLFAQDIDTALAAHSAAPLTAALDQDGFNRALGLTDYVSPVADRLLAGRTAHGTHVMGLAGGADPLDDLQRRFSDRVRFLVVSLPPLFAYGDGGAFLDFYLIYALRWIIEANARIAEKSGLARPCPLVTNISFGKHAGSKDAAQPFVGAMADHVASGSEAPIDTVVGRVPFHTVMPAGNSNLDARHARFSLGVRGEKAEMDWVIQPDDASSNFLEIWCDHPAASGDGKAPLAIELVPPGQKKAGFSVGRDGQVSHLGRAGGAGPKPLARIHCQRIDRPGQMPQARFRYLVCLAPDRYRSDSWSSPPAGRWRLRLKSRSDQALDVRVMVQTDQSAMPGIAAARSSYLDDPTDQRWASDGRLQDSYDCGFMTPGPLPENRDLADYLRRHGTLNAYAANTHVAAIAGYRARDGRPAAYSSTGLGAAVGTDDRATPTAALPTDDGYMHLGVLSDGSSDGSVVPMQGTSFASAMATRMVLEAWLAREHDPYGPVSIKSFLADKAQAQHAPPGWNAAPVASEKVGAGRIVFSQPGRVPRL